MISKHQHKEIQLTNKPYHPSILANHHLSQTERFWVIEERTKEMAKVLRECLDGHTRSKMEFFMMVMIAHDMMTEDDISKFSEEVQERMSSHFR